MNGYRSRGLPAPEDGVGLIESGMISRADRRGRLARSADRDVHELSQPRRAMNTNAMRGCLAAPMLAILLHSTGAAAQPARSAGADRGAKRRSPPDAAAGPRSALEPSQAALQAQTHESARAMQEVRQMETALEEQEAGLENALSSFVQLVGDAKAQTTTSGESSAAFGGGILYRGPDQSILILARTEASSEALDTQVERGALMLTPESTGQPSFEFDWRVYFVCVTRPLAWRTGSCADHQAAEEAGEATSTQRRAASRDRVDLGARLYLSGGTADWTIPAGDPADDAITRRASVLAYGVDVILRREFIKGLDNYVALEAGVGGTVRNLIGDLTAGENRGHLEAFLGTDRKVYVGPEFYIGLTINALNVGISLPVIPYGEIDGFSGGQLLVTAIVRDGPKLVIPD
jgi:hypothetical protein